MTKKPKAKKRKVPKGKRRPIAKPVIPDQILTPRQQRFIEEYLVDLNGTQAAIRAGYSKASAYAIGSENLRKHNIAEAITTALRETARSTPARLVEELAALAFSDIGNAVVWDQQTEHLGDGDGSYFGGPSEQDAEGNIVKVITSRVTVLPSHTMDPRTRLAVASISQSDKGALKITMHDKANAIDKLLRVFGMYQDKTEHHGTIAIVPQLTYLGAPPKILARKSGDDAPSKAVGRDRDESD